MCVPVPYNWLNFKRGVLFFVLYTCNGLYNAREYKFNQDRLFITHVLIVLFISIDQKSICLKDCLIDYYNYYYIYMFP